MCPGVGTGGFAVNQVYVNSAPIPSGIYRGGHCISRIGTHPLSFYSTTSELKQAVASLPSLQDNDKTRYYSSPGLAMCLEGQTKMRQEILMQVPVLQNHAQLEDS